MNRSQVEGLFLSSVFDMAKIVTFPLFNKSLKKYKKTFPFLRGSSSIKKSRFNHNLCILESLWVKYLAIF